MKIKVCGMCDAENIRRVGMLAIDFMGFIFYQKSPRFAGNGLLPPEALWELPANVCKTGVFVSESLDVAGSYVAKYKLNAIQLHGKETPEYIGLLKENFPEILIIKAFPVSDSSDFLLTKAYEAVCDYFLFDTRTLQYGGSGKQFDWTLIEAYRGKTPFFLSGGISVEDAVRIKQIQHPALYGVDLNSRFELSAGIKDLNLLQQFIETLKT
ncbi:N-(5'-phosphoribosyl)anthranilate isomerase [Bacteroidia bacterium]|nr:N-(5'-phosphoribosyl)anthranilate isomerase [Bacteroidia bacterium]